MASTKVCIVCNQEKDLIADFYPTNRAGALGRCKPCTVTSVARYQARIKAEVFSTYGNCCACCGELEMAFLTIDHVSGGGRQERIQNKMSSNKLFLTIRRLGFPPAYQILCANCNMAKHTRGVCPHQKEEN